jgi:exonuclease VII small subunit
MSIEDHLKTAQLYLNEAFKLYEEGYRADVCE